MIRNTLAVALAIAGLTTLAVWIVLEFSAPRRGVFQVNGRQLTLEVPRRLERAFKVGRQNDRATFRQITVRAQDGTACVSSIRRIPQAHPVREVRWGYSWLGFTMNSVPDRTLSDQPSAQKPPGLIRPGISTKFKLLHWEVRVPLLGIFVVLMSYPTLIVVRGPIRRYWRRKHGLCYECGYDLTGNLSGTCPECATPVPNPDDGGREVRDAQ